MWMRISGIRNCSGKNLHILTLQDAAYPVRLKNNPVALSEDALRYLYNRILPCEN